jgi:hypothetical protein
MSLFKYLNIPVFIVSLAVGLFFVYVYSEDKRKIMVYPTPDNVNTLQYKDETGTCFEFKEKSVKCPANESEIAKVPTA